MLCFCPSISGRLAFKSASLVEISVSPPFPAMDFDPPNSNSGPDIPEGMSTFGPLLSTSGPDMPVFGSWTSNLGPCTPITGPEEPGLLGLISKSGLPTSILRPPALI